MRDFISIADLQKDGTPFAGPNFKRPVIDALMGNGTLDMGGDFQFWVKMTSGRHDYECDGYTLNQAFYGYFNNTH